ncbi:MAG: DNA polymerase IV [Angelakisella sp.]|nr:DNA polymerase IV [Angelakisella sp.]
MGDRTILHCDCNGFYASVECILRPELRDVPMAVCGNPENRHGIILAKNEHAKKYGIVTAETVWQALKKCPNLVLVPPHHDLYAKYSKKVNKIYECYTDLVEPFGIDESWLDVTGSMHLFGTGEEIANELRRRVREEIGLTISVGVSYNKIYAKLGSDYKKPDATTVITRENHKQIVYPLPVGDLLYVGKAAAATLRGMGITTIGQLAQARPELVAARLGKTGEQLVEYARGEEHSPVRSAYESSEVKSVGNGMTFRRNLLGMEDISAGITALSDTVASRLRRHGLLCQTVQVLIKDPQFRSISRQRALEVPTHLASEITKVALQIIEEEWRLELPIRMLTITGMNLIPAESAVSQTSLFGQAEDKQREKWEKLESAMDIVRQKYGRDAVSFGGTLGTDLGLEPHRRGEDDPV